MNGRGELWRIVASMTITCALGALVLGGVYVATDRYQKAAEIRSESRAIVELLGLDSTATVLDVRQFLRLDQDLVVYRAKPFGEETAAERELVFSLDGTLVSQDSGPGSEAGERDKNLRPLGRLFVARQGGQPAGFVVEGSARGYKNRIRFLIGITRGFEIAGVRVVEHEEDPGLGAEVATRVFEDQFYGRSADQLSKLDVTRDPMPEDWRAALLELQREPAAEWRERHGDLLDRERSKPIYAVTGATISSRALTSGVRVTVDHFRRRWTLLSPFLGGST